jgi:hypothetical protein
MSAAKVAGRLFFVGTSFLVADDYDLVLIDFRESTQDGSVVAEMFVAVQLDKFIEHQIQIITRMWTVFMPSYLDRLPRSQLAVNLLSQIVGVAAQSTEFVVYVAGPRLLIQLRNLLLQFVKGLFEFESWRWYVHFSFRLSVIGRQ